MSKKKKKTTKILIDPGGQVLTDFGIPRQSLYVRAF